tara:strand:+ start:224 stop:406 length:183 start_codon:yes stop_codon:yes gene_type:complete
MDSILNDKIKENYKLRKINKNLKIKIVNLKKIKIKKMELLNDKFKLLRLDSKRKFDNITK